MAMVKCKECGTEVSNTAKKCPQCGVDHPGVSKTQTAMGCLILIVIISAVIVTCSESSKETEEEKAACMQDLKCWGDRHSIAAQIACKTPIENMAKYSFTWMDGSMFSRYTLSGNGKVSYMGDHIQFQNGFGANQRMSYMCQYDPATKTVTEVVSQPGVL